ncbi:MAG: S9 family peptidase [Euryarchaeota archaeon]|nr:S9 family peptidase [Euryarchaeota archaeon]
MAWKPDTFTKFSYLQDVNISKDGALVSYVIKRANLKENKYENTLVIEDLKNGERKYVDDGVMPRFAPNGKKLVFLRTDEEKKRSDLYLLDIKSMTATRLVEAKNIKGVAWHRESRKIAILISQKNDDEDLWYDSSVPVWFNGEGFRDGEKFKIQIYDTEGKVVVEEFEDERIANIFWHGDSIIYTSFREDAMFKYYDLRMWDGEIKNIMENVPFAISDTNGADILLIGKKGREKISEHSYLYIFREGEIIPINEKYGLDTMDGKIDAQGNVYGVVADSGSYIIEKYEKDKKRITPDRSMSYFFSVSDTGKIAFILSSATSPGEVYIYEKKMRQLTAYNVEILRILNPLPYRHFRFKSFDSKSIDAWYIKPKGRKKAPLVVFVHGGPKGMYGYYFRYEMQLLASRGYYVLFVNPRGSTGYDEEFALEVLHHTGEGDFQDIMYGIETLLKMEKRIDSKRIGITGISYGGFMTNWAVTQSPIFKAAISENGISYWFTSYAFSDVGLWYDKEVVGEEPFKDDTYRRLSPLFYVDNVKASILLIHSMEDYRCPIDQSLMFYHLLKERKKDAHMLMFKKGAHGHSIYASPRHRLKRYKIFVEFFDAKLNDKEFDIKKVLKGE